MPPLSVFVRPSLAPPHILYVSDSDFYRKASNNAGMPELLVEESTTRTGTTVNPYFFAPDETAIVFADRTAPGTGDDLGMVSTDDPGDLVWRLAGAYNERNAELSSDARWIAYQSDQSGV